MRRGGVATLLLTAALAFPAPADAVDHVVLIVSPTKLPAFGGWKLDGRVVDAGYGGGTEIFGVSLSRSFLRGRADELHGFRAAPAATVTFDGATGRWSAALSDVTVRMTITAAGSPQDVPESQGCRGAFSQVPVELRGTFALRTRTSLFKTIRRTRFGGSVVFNRGGPVDCTPLPTAECSPSRSLNASRADASAAIQSWSTDRGGLNVSFADRRRDGTAWYHVMWMYGFDPFAGTLPTITLRLPRSLPISGTGSFTAKETKTDPGQCNAVSATGTFSGAFRTRFVGWGARVLALSSASGAYRQIG